MDSELVITWASVKLCNEPIVDMRVMNRTMARSCGKVTWKNVRHPFAPSMAAASY